MPTFKPQEFYGSLRSKKFEPVYILAGEETYLIEEALSAIERTLNSDPLNKEVFFASDLSVDNLIMAAQTLPFLSDKRLLIVKDAHKIKTTERAKLSEFLQNPSETTCLIILWPERLKKDMKKSDLFAIVEKNGMVVEFKALYDRELPVWIIQKLKAQGKRITHEAVQYLISEPGSNMLDLENEMDKLVLFTNKEQEITLNDVELMSGHTRMMNLNQFAEVVEAKKTGDALKVLEGLLSEGEIPLKILATLYRVFRRFIVAKSLMLEHKMTDSEVKQTLRLHMYFDRYFFTNIAKFSMQELKENITLIMEADMKLKSSSMPEQFILEELLLNLTSDVRSKTKKKTAGI